LKPFHRVFGNAAEHIAEPAWMNGTLTIHQGKSQRADVLPPDHHGSGDRQLPP
jgi:hypothetical protein